MYVDRGATLDEYAQALPRADGQSGAPIAIAREVVCLDYVSRSDVFAGLYLKLLRGYGLDALERPLERRVAKATVERFLAAVVKAPRAEQPASGCGIELRFNGRAGGSELQVGDEVVALTAFVAKPLERSTVCRCLDNAQRVRMVNGSSTNSS